MSSPTCTKLPGTGIGRLFGQPSLWLAGDHILKVSVSVYTEEYRRFYLRDIRGFVVRKTNAMLVWMALLGVLFVGLGLAGISLVSVTDTTERIWGGLLLSGSVGCLIGFVVNLVKGPSCEFFIKTAIQVDRVKSLSRLKSADKLIEVLTPLIMEAQKTSANAADPVSTSASPGA